MRRLSIPLILSLALLGSAAHADDNIGGFSAGIEVRGKATASELGLPVYPGAKLQINSGDDKGAVSLGLWGGAFGLKLAVAKFSSGDKFEELLDFYKRAMGGHGVVLECRAANSGTAAKAEGEDRISCKDAEPGKDGLVLKVGKPKDLRIVAIQSKGKETHFQIVRIEAKGH